MEENWLPVVGSEFHQVSDRGRVRSRRGGNGKLLPEGEWRICDLTSHGKGYVEVDINGSLRLVHHLVLEAFRGLPEPDQEACHFPDATRTNNRINNLRWGSRSENRQDCVRHGRLNTQKITEDEAWGIKLLLGLGVEGTRIREVYPKSSVGIISNIKLSKTWEWLTTP